VAQVRGLGPSDRSSISPISVTVEIDLDVWTIALCSLRVPG